MQGVICWDIRTAIPQIKSSIAGGGEINCHNGEGIRVMEGVSGGAREPTMGLRHWVMVWGHLRGPSWCLLARGWSSRGEGDGGARSLPLPLPLCSDRG